ncbi:MAG: hypothetical protein DCC75_10620, partial [Proteobacteria bacterium]
MLLTAAHLFLELTKTKTVQVAEAPAAAAPAHQLLLRNEDFGETLRSSIPALLRELPKDSIVSISCIDYRIGELPGYHLTSAGNIPHGALVEDLHLVLPEKKLLLLSCHTDCAKSKTQLPRMEGETEESYSVRLEAHTLAR